MFRIQIDTLDAPNLVEWTCVGDFDGWTGAKLDFRLTALEEDRTQLEFSSHGVAIHRRRRSDAQHRLGVIHVEGRDGGPMMR